MYFFLITCLSLNKINNNTNRICCFLESAIPKLVPSDIELPAQSDSAESVNTQNYDSSVCDGAHLKLSGMFVFEDTKIIL